MAGSAIFLGACSGFGIVLVFALTGVMVSVLIERLLRPAVPWRRHWAAWGLHTGLWLFAYAIVVWLLGRPAFSMLVVSAVLLTLVLVNNAKFKTLREPFVFQDYEYFTDALKHPRLYIPFMGWRKFLAATTGFVLAAYVGLWSEPALEARFAWSSQSAAIASVLTFAVLAIILGHYHAAAVTMAPQEDISRLGFLTMLWRYAQQTQRMPVAATPFSGMPSKMHAKALTPPSLPSLVSVQSESFFDARALWPGIRSDVLAGFDALRDDAARHGRLRVPAWGANTVRTEFAFLSGIDAKNLGAHRFNPYRAVSAGMQITSLASWLKQLGYRTICIHPYPASFYSRERVMPLLGFDEFIDIRSFGKDQRYGAYIADRAVARKISEILKTITKPVFIHAITMENHGPLHLERVRPKDIGRLYAEPPPVGFDDLTVYLRHLRNADRMVTDLRRTMENLEYPASLCWFGDHVPILPALYEKFSAPAGDVEYAIWNNWKSADKREQDVAAHELACDWLYAAGLRNQ